MRWALFPETTGDEEDSDWQRFTAQQLPVGALHRLNGVTVITTMNTHSLVYRLVFGNAIKKAVFAGTFRKLGYKNRKWINLNMVKFVKEQKRKQWLEELAARFARLQ